MKTRLTITHETETELPPLPLFIKCDGQQIDVKDFAWKQALIVHATERAKAGP